MSMKKNNVIYWVLKAASIVISCLFPIIAICDKFPVWTEKHGTGRSIGTGGILIAIVLLVIFRKTVFEFIKDRLKLHHAPPLVVWLILLIIGYVFLGVSRFLSDIILVFWMGFLGCGLGTLLTMVAEVCFGKETENDEGT